MNYLLILSFYIFYSHSHLIIPITKLNKDSNTHKHIPSQKTNSLQLTNIFNTQYSGTIQLGSNKQSFNVLFDTGSTIFWVWPQYYLHYQVFSQNCTGCTLNSPNDYSYSRQFFNCDQSATCKQYKSESYTYNKFEIKIISIQYGIGEVSGYTTGDSLYLKDQKIDDFQFLQINMGQNTNQIIADGICGLGLIEEDGFSNLINELHKENIIKKRIFGFYLIKEKQGQQVSFHLPVNHSSLLMIGGVDQQYYETDLAYFELASSKKWSINLQKVKINDKEMKLKTTSALVDSGTSLIVLPADDFEELLHQLRESYNLFCQFMEMQIQCSCANGDISVFPQIDLYFANHTNSSFSLKPSDYISIQVSVCQLGFTKSQEETQWILGEVFMQKYLTVFDMDNSRIGFAKTNLFRDEAKSIQMNDSLVIFELLLGSIIAAIFFIWLIKKLSNLSQ